MKIKRVITTIVAGFFALNLFTFGKVGASASTSQATEFSDDFNGGALKEEWLPCAVEEEGAPSLTQDGKLDLTVAGSSVVYTQKAERLDSRTETTFTLGAKLEIADMSVGGAMGFEIGKPNADAPFGVFFGVSRTQTGYQFVKLGDQASEYGESVCVENQSQLTFRLQLVLYYHNWVELFVNGEKVQSFYSERSAGYFALASKNAFGVNAVQGGYMDDFVFTTNNYEESFAFNRATNFNGTKPSGSGRAFFVNAKEWYISGNAKVQGSVADSADGKLCFENADENTVFGPNERFADYMVKFDLEIGGGAYTEENDGEAFGLCLGKGMPSLGNDTAVGLGITRKDGKSVAYAFDKTQNAVRPLNAQEDESVEFWSENGGVYQFIYLVRGGKVKMYFKEATQDESVLGILRAEYEVGNTYGYFSVFGINGIDFQMDNFSVINLSHGTSTLEYIEGERLENLHMLFSEEASLKAYEFTDAKTYEGILHVSENGKLETKGDVLNYILRISVQNAGDSFTVGHGERKIEFNANGRTVKLVGYGETEKTVLLDRRLYLDGVILEISCIGDVLTIAYANNTDPLARMEKAVEIEIPMTTERGKISVTATEGATALTALSVFNFDMNATIKTRDFDALTDESSPWIDKPTGAVAEGENLLKKNFGYLVLAGCTAVAVVIFLIDWRRKNKKEEDE